jgi:hypothetical protein
MSIRQPRGPRPSNQSWKLPSSCTSSPKCDRRSRRWQCLLRLRCRLHILSSNIQRRTVSSSSTIPSSSAKCSAAKVGRIAPPPPRNICPVFHGIVDSRGGNRWGRLETSKPGRTQRPYERVQGTLTRERREGRSRLFAFPFQARCLLVQNFSGALEIGVDDR